jgi:hypothetical protein
MKIVFLLGLIITSSLNAAPEILKTTQQDNGSQINYKGGWVRIVQYIGEGKNKGMFIADYNPQKQIARNGVGRR